MQHDSSLFFVIIILHSFKQRSPLTVNLKTIYLKKLLVRSKSLTLQLFKNVLFTILEDLKHLREFNQYVTYYIIFELIIITKSI